MKKMMILSVIAISAVFASCNKVTQLANINVDIPYNQQVSVPQIPGAIYGIPLPPGGATLNFPAVPVATNSQDYIAQNKTSIEKVVNVYLKSLAIQILSPANQNFDFLDNIQVYISSKSQPERIIADQYNIPKGQTTLNLATSTDVNLKNYFIEDTIYFRLNAHINAVPISGTQLNIASVFHMLANPLL